MQKDELTRIYGDFMEGEFRKIKEELIVPDKAEGLLAQRSLNYRNEPDCAP